jgi:hypothetical protein
VKTIVLPESSMMLLLHHLPLFVTNSSMSFIKLYMISPAAETTGILKEQDPVREDDHEHGNS